MPVNMGIVDRAVRTVLGIILILLPFVLAPGLFANQTIAWVVAAIGAVFVVTSAIKFCPLYTVIGLKTCKDC